MRFFEPGDHCPKCGGVLEVHSHDRPTRTTSKYWYRSWFVCPRCNAVYMDERTKVVVALEPDGQGVLWP